MKTFVVLIVFVLFAKLGVYSQEYKLVDTVEYIVNYDYTVQRDSVDKESKITELMSLYIGHNLSEFQFYAKYISDSVFYVSRNREEYKLEMEVYNATKNLPPASYFTFSTIFKKLKTDECNYYEYLKKLHGVRMNIIFDWELLSNSDTIINGYNAIKASTSYAGRKYEAWYTLEIPIQEGPYLFHGLPGLIVKIQDVNKEHVWGIKSFKQTSNKYIYAIGLDMAIDVCMEDFIKARKNFIEDRIRMYGGNNRVQLSNSDYGDVANKLKRKNNFIEKY